MDNSLYYESGYMFLIFNNSPDVENTNTFTTEITLEDEREFTTQLDPIIIRP